MIHLPGNKKLSINQVIVIALAFLLAFFLVRLVLLQGKWTTLREPEKEYSIEYPASWHISTYTNGYRHWPELYADLDPPGFLTTNQVWILGEKLAQPTSIDTVAWSEELIDRHHGNYVSEPEWTVVGLHAYPAIKRTFTRMNRYHITAYYITTDNFLIALEFRTNFNQSDNDIQKTFAHMLGSFEIIDEQ